jgi:hypothetical protein
LEKLERFPEAIMTLEEDMWPHRSTAFSYTLVPVPGRYPFQYTFRSIGYLQGERRIAMFILLIGFGMILVFLLVFAFIFFVL